MDGSREGLSRRRFVQGAAGGLVAGAAAGGVAWAAGAVPPPPGGESDASGDREVDLTRRHPFLGEPHPPGVQTPPQRHAMVMAFDVAAGATVDDLRTLLARWTAAIALLADGRPVGRIRPPGEHAIGQDTGEAEGLDPAGLTITVGLGPGLFDRRFGLADRKPALLDEIPPLPSDDLDPDHSGGDFCIQACADDPQVTYHAVRNLARIGRGTVHTRWTVLGFGRASAGAGQATPRNLFGFKDGTRNVTEPVDFDRHVWVSGDDWMSGGTYQVVRKIAMNIETWDTDPLGDQERIFGRTKAEGGPLSGGAEFAVPDFAALGADGKKAIDPHSHIALSAPETNGGISMHRRSYNYTDGLNGFGQLDAGLLFIAFVNDPANFTTIQRRLGTSDRLNEYISHIGSGVYAVPPAPARGHFLAEALFQR